MRIESRAIAFDIIADQIVAVPSAPTFAQRLSGFFSSSQSPNSTIGRLSHCPMLTT